MEILLETQNVNGRTKLKSDDWIDLVDRILTVGIRGEVGPWRMTTWLQQVGGRLPLNCWIVWLWRWGECFGFMIVMKILLWLFAYEFLLQHPQWVPRFFTEGRSKIQQTDIQKKLSTFLSYNKDRIVQSGNKGANSARRVWLGDSQWRSKGRVWILFPRITKEISLWYSYSIPSKWTLTCWAYFILYSYVEK